MISRPPDWTLWQGMREDVQIDDFQSRTFSGAASPSADQSVHGFVFDSMLRDCCAASTVNVTADAWANQFSDQLSAGLGADGTWARDEEEWEVGTFFELTTLS